MNKTLLASALALSLGLGPMGLCSTAFAQSPPVGGPDAKGNAPLKHMHTVNDGSAKPGANSFTEGQARQHILNSGYTDVTGLAKGKDGVWRGMASHNGSQVNVAMDFKGNVTEASGGAGASAMSSSSSQTTSAMPAGGGDQGGMAAGGAAAGGAAAGGAAVGAMAMHHHHHMHPHHHHQGGRCANPGPNGVACSGVDSTGNGVSDKEKNAMQAGAHP